MKAAVVEGPNLLKVRDVPEPELEDYESLCDLLYGATCTGTDSHIIEGCFPWTGALPTILGHESIGRVIKVGRKVTRFKEGDLVTRVGTKPVGGCSVTWGGFSTRGVAVDYRAMQADGVEPGKWMWYKPTQVIPAHFDPRAATLIITWRETLSYITRMGVVAGAKVLVIGSGGNGLAFASHARNLGAAQIAMIGSGARAQNAADAGVGDYVDYKTPDTAGILSAKCPGGFDFVIDALGKTGLMDLGLSLLRPGGTMAVYGLDDMGKTTLNPLRSRGTFTIYNGGYDEEESHETVVRWIGEGTLIPGPWLDVTRPYPLSEIGQAFESLAARKNVKALIQLQGV